MDNNAVLHLPENFTKACERFSIHPLEALQFFISKTTVYANLVKPPETIYAVASNIFDQWLRSKGAANGKMDEFKQLFGLKYVKELMRMVMAKDDPAKREKAYKRIIEKWYRSIADRLPPKAVQVTNDMTVLLTRDFCILCDIFRGTPANLLQYYVNHITLSACIESPIEFAMPTGFFMQYPPILRQIQAN